MKAIAPNTEGSVPGSDSPSARRTLSISSTRSYRVRCCSSDSTSCGSSRPAPPASLCNAQATRYPETGVPSAIAHSLISALSARVQRSVRRTTPAIASGPRRRAALGIGAAGDRPPAFRGSGSVGRSNSASRSSHASTASPSAFQRSSSPMSAMRCCSIFASRRSSRTARRKTVSGSGPAHTVALCTM